MTNVEKAIAELEKLGVPVKDSKMHGGHFWMSNEEERSDEFFSYYDHRKDWNDWMINDKVHEILDKHGLFAEWQNPAIIVVFDA